MISPFIKLDITMKLSYRDLVVLNKVITSTLPDQNAEGAIIYIHSEVQKQIEKVEKL